MINQPYKKCLAYDCQKEAAYNFPCCSVDCGYEFKTIPGQIKKAQEGIGRWTEWLMGLREVSIGAIIYYSKSAELL